MYIWSDPETGKTNSVSGNYREIVKHFDELSLYWIAVGAKYQGVHSRKKVSLSSALLLQEVNFYKFELKPDHLFDIASTQDLVADFFGHDLEMGSELLIVGVHFTDEHNWPDTSRN